VNAATQEVIHLKPKYLFRWGQKYKGKILDEQSIQLSNQQIVQGVPATIEWNQRNPIGVARLVIDNKGVKVNIEITDVAAYVNKTHDAEFDVAWTAAIKELHTKWIGEYQHIASAMIPEVTLLPKHLVGDRTPMRVLK
jgi:uncharacterized protein GlcG (DUF336 family)